MASAIVTVGSTVFPEITGLVPTHEKIVNFERDSEGNGHGDIIALKWKLQINFGVLTAEQTKAILSSTLPFSFQVSFYDPETGSSGSFIGYEGNKSFPLLGKDPKGGYMTNGGSINLIEI